VFELVRWGLPRLPKSRDRSDAFNPRWVSVAMQTAYSAEAAQGLNETYEFRVDGEVFTAEVSDGRVRMLDGPASDPAAVISTDAETFLALGNDLEVVAKAVDEGRLRTEGSAEAIQHCREIFAPMQAQAVPAGA
jgi:hypothetical protein